MCEILEGKAVLFTVVSSPSTWLTSSRHQLYLRQMRRCAWSTYSSTLLATSENGKHLQQCLGQEAPRETEAPQPSHTGGPQLDWAALIPRAMVYRGFPFRPSTTMLPFYFPKKQSALEHLDPTVRTQWAYPVWKHVLLWRCLFPSLQRKNGCGHWNPSMCLTTCVA